MSYPFQAFVKIEKKSERLTPAEFAAASPVRGRRLLTYLNAPPRTTHNAHSRPQESSNSKGSGNYYNGLYIHLLHTDITTLQYM